MGRRKGSKNVCSIRKSAIIDMVIRAKISYGNVAKAYEISRTTVKSILRRYKVNAHRKVRGRKQKLHAGCIERLLRILYKNRFKPLHITVSEFRTWDGEKLSLRSIRRYVHKQGFTSYMSISKPFLTPTHVLRRLDWAKTHEPWTFNDWSNVLFSDESTFNLRPKYLRRRVWRKVGTRNDTMNLTPTYKSGYVSLSVWGGFTARGRTPLVRIDGFLNQDKYKSILEDYVLPFAENIHGGLRNFVFQQDGCGPHRAQSIRMFLESNGVKVLPWPAQSPDLNPIENVWAIMKNQLRGATTFPTSKDALFAELCNVWNALPDSYFTKLSLSMSTRVESLMQVGGHQTKY